VATLGLVGQRAGERDKDLNDHRRGGHNGHRAGQQHERRRRGHHDQAERADRQ
jgi:hypothetical protein